MYPLPKLFNSRVCLEVISIREYEGSINYLEKRIQFSFAALLYSITTALALATELNSEG